MEGSPHTYVPKVAIRKPAPPINATAYFNYDFTKVNLDDYKGKYIVLFFYPLDFTFVCPTEIIAFSDAQAKFTEFDCQILGCSIDSQFSHMEYCMKTRKQGGLGDMKIPLISDLSKQISKDYGTYIDHGEDNGVSFRSTFIIDKEGIVRHISMNDLPVGRSIEEIARLVQAFQYTDIHGEVCPAKWKPGDATMDPDHKSDKTKEYWEKEHDKK